MKKEDQLLSESFIRDTAAKYRMTVEDNGDGTVNITVPHMSPKITRELSLANAVCFLYGYDVAIANVDARIKMLRDSLRRSLAKGND